MLELWTVYDSPIDLLLWEPLEGRWSLFWLLRPSFKGEESR